MDDSVCVSAWDAQAMNEINAYRREDRELGSRAPQNDEAFDFLVWQSPIQACKQDSLSEPPRLTVYALDELRLRKAGNQTMSWRRHCPECTLAVASSPAKGQCEVPWLKLPANYCLDHQEGHDI